MPLTDRVRIGERRREPLRQKPRTRRGHSPVDGGKQRAAPFAGKRTDKLEIAACRLVDEQRRAGRLAHGRSERRPLAELGALNVGAAGGRCGELEPRQLAESLRAREAEIAGQPAFGRRALEHVSRERRHRRQRPQIRSKLAIPIERIGNDDLARFETRNFGGESGAVALGDAEFAGHGDRLAIAVAGQELLVGEGERTERVQLDALGQLPG